MTIFEKKEADARVDQALEGAGAAEQLVKLKAALDRRDEEIKGALEDLAAKVKAKADPGEIEGLVKRVDELGGKAGEIAANMLALEQKLARPMGGGAAPGKTLGEVIIGNDDVQTMMKGKAKMAKIEVKSLETKAITSGAASAGALVQPERLALVAPPEQVLLVRSLLMPGVTESNALEFPREKLFTNNAAPQTAELATKAESDLTFEMVSVTVKTIAHFMYASKQIMQDAPQLASYINGRLIYGLKLAEEKQILLGDGTGQNMLGIIPQATTYQTALETSLAIQSKNKMDVLRVAMLQVQLAQYPPSGIVLHPTDWAAITLAKDANGNYLIANPQSAVSQLLWTLPVVPSMSMTPKDFLVGAFTLGAQIHDREQSSVSLSFEDGDNFRKNAVTILAEERLALTVYRPQSFVHGTFA